MLFTRTAVGYLTHKRFQYDFDKDPTDFLVELPHDAVPTEAHSAQHTWIIPRRFAAQSITTPLQLAPETVIERVGTTQAWEQDLLQELPSSNWRKWYGRPFEAPSVMRHPMDPRHQIKGPSDGYLAINGENVWSNAEDLLMAMPSHRTKRRHMACSPF